MSSVWLSATLKPMWPPEGFISWSEMWRQKYPEVSLSPEENWPSGDHDATEMHRLRGVVIVQAAETEAALGAILRLLDPSDDRGRPAGALLAAVKNRLDAHTRDRWSCALDTIEAAIRRRNRIAHDTVHIGYSWREYATGDGGEHVPVTSLLGSDLCDEADLRNDLNRQREATECAVEILHYLEHRDGESKEARYCRTCIENKEDQRTDCV